MTIKEQDNQQRLKCDERCPKCHAAKGGLCKDHDSHNGDHICNECNHVWDS